MQRIPYPNKNELSQTTQKVLSGTNLNVIHIAAHASPSLFDAQGQLGMAIANPDVLEPSLREAVILRVAHLSRSDYELHHHVALARLAGLSDIEIDAIANGDYHLLTPLHEAAVRFTDDVVVHLSPSDEVLNKLKTLTSDQIVMNIILTIGCYMSIARVIAVTGIELDDDTLNQLPDSNR